MDEYEVSIGSDLEGNECLYVLKNGEYLDGDDMATCANILRNALEKEAQGD